MMQRKCWFFWQKCKIETRWANLTVSSQVHDWLNLQPCFKSPVDLKSIMLPLWIRPHAADGSPVALVPSMPI